MSGKLSKFKSLKKQKVKTLSSVKNAEKKKVKYTVKSDFMDLMTEDVWDYMNEFDVKELK
jgi:hypothetical protein